jgi:hypothetical protein
LRLHRRLCQNLRCNTTFISTGSISEHESVPVPYRNMKTNTTSEQMK